MAVVASTRRSLPTLEGAAKWVLVLRMGAGPELRARGCWSRPALLMDVRPCCPLQHPSPHRSNLTLVLAFPCDLWEVDGAGVAPGRGGCCVSGFSTDVSKWERWEPAGMRPDLVALHRCVPAPTDLLDEQPWPVPS